MSTNKLYQNVSPLQSERTPNKQTYFRIFCQGRGFEEPRTWQLGHLKEWAGFLVSGILTLPSVSP